jgi:hypothetical protein
VPTQLWVQRYNGVGSAEDVAKSVAVAPGGGKVFVTGRSHGTRATGEADYATVAYNTATGAQLWVKRYNGPGNNFDEASAVAVSPNGPRVFVTGKSYGITPNGDYATVAYNASTGRPAVGRPVQRPGQERRRGQCGDGQPER